MFKLHRVNEDTFRVVSNMIGVDSEGTANEMRCLMNSLGAGDDQILYALNTMVEKGHNTAEFGMNLDDPSKSNFMFSGNYRLQYKHVREVEFIQIADAKANAA